MSKRKLYEDQVREKLQQLEGEIDRLKQQIKNAETELLPERHSKIESLHSLKEETKEKFQELLAASDDAWEELQEGVEHYWKALGNELKAYDGDPEH
jgi:chromosome segregation ATPase